MTTTERDAAALLERLGGRPVGLWAAPGRVNLIGEHTDYNDGFVLPFAIEQRAVVALAPSPDGRWRFASAQTGDVVDAAPGELTPGTLGWAGYLAGVVWALAERGIEAEPQTVALASDVPLGAGLSSSAAIECALVAALADLTGADLAPLERARVARRAENGFVGAPTGLLDQAASTLCREGAALLLDCRSGDARPVDLGLDAAGLEIVVVDTRTPHAHVDGEYAARRRSCEAAAEQLGVPALRDVTDLDAALARLDDDVLRRRVRHVVTENARVLAAAAAFDAGRPRDVAPLLDASQASMRDDYEITVGTVDLACDTLTRHGALGARMTGGGFGGCVLAVAPAGSADALGGAVAAAFADAGHAAPTWFTARPSAGARRVG